MRLLGSELCCSYLWSLVVFINNGDISIPFYLLGNRDILNQIRQHINALCHGFHAFFKRGHFQLEFNVFLSYDCRRLHSIWGGNLVGAALRSCTGTSGLFRSGSPRRAARSFDFLEPFGLSPLKLGVEKSPIVCGCGFESSVNSDRVVRLDFAKGIKVELSDERAEFPMLEELRNNFLLEFLWVLNDESFSVLGPRAYTFFTGVDHVVGFS
mmetsp:Transcript_3228/g.6971  ORF Transcript_3228/g.6971 Transcript_3228/m.6971 type:complete len:211 (+) Transcript_3228:1266-1898(+)